MRKQLYLRRSRFIEGKSIRLINAGNIKIFESLFNFSAMIIENKKKIQEYLEQLPDKYMNEILEYLQFLEFKTRNENADTSSMLLSEDVLAKDWLTPEEDEAWQHL